MSEAQQVSVLCPACGTTTLLSPEMSARVVGTCKVICPNCRFYILVEGDQPKD